MNCPVKVSICIPVYDMEDGDYFLERNLASIRSQSFQDFEIVITRNKGGWAANHNQAIKEAKGEIIKFLHQDDFFHDKDSLKRIVEAFKGGWLVTGCVHSHGKDRFNKHLPRWNDKLPQGENTIGGPSVLAIENNKPLLFADMTWLVDCEYYQRLYERYGPPTILNSIDVVIGIHKGQATNLIPNDIKAKEVEMMQK